MVSVLVSLNFKRISKIFHQETIAASENRFASELNEEEIFELLENAKPGSIKKATGKMRHEIFQGKNLKTIMTT